MAGQAFRFDSGDQLKRLAADLKKQGKGEARKAMAKRLKNAVAPIPPEMRRKIRSLPSSGTPRSPKAVQARPRGLRDATARGVQIKVNLTGRSPGVRVRVDTRHFPEGQHALPKYLNGTIPRWRHPTWGHDPWVNQLSHEYFENTITPHLPKVGTEMEKVMSDVADELSRG